MTTPPRKRDPSDFFKPYTRKNISPTPVIPRKRPSPSVDEDGETTAISVPPRPESPTKSSQPERLTDDPNITPKRKNAPSSPPRSGTSVSIPFRTPQSRTSAERGRIYGHGKLFSQPKRTESPLSKMSSHKAPEEIPMLKRTGSTLEEVLTIPDSDEDDSSSLESLEDIFGTRRDGVTTSSSSPAETDVSGNNTAKPRSYNLFPKSTSGPLVGKEKLRALNAKQRAQRFDIESLIGDHFDDEEIEANVHKARLGYEASTKEIELGTHIQLDRNILASLSQINEGDGDGGDNVSRLIDAVDRTEALSFDQTYSFFGTRGLHKPTKSDLIEYETAEDEDVYVPWPKGDNSARSRSLRSGCLNHTRTQPPDRLLKWVFDIVTRERRDDLRQAYVDFLSSWSSVWTRTKIDARDVQMIFQKLGAEPINIQDKAPIKPNSTSIVEPRSSGGSKYLCTVLDLFTALCPDMDFLALGRLSSILIRLAVDVEVMKDAEISMKVEKLIQTLLTLPDREARLFVAEKFLTDSAQHIHDPTLQSNLLAHILPVSTTTSNLRTHLALIFLLGPEHPQRDLSSAPTISLDDLTEFVFTSPYFNTSRGASKSSSNPHMIDYTALRHRTAILDIAVGDGRRPNNFASRSAENLFNRSVDDLANKIRSILISITDTGASHMRRTEAKDSLQAFHSRLLYCVRTEVRPKKHIFDMATNTKIGRSDHVQLRDADEVRSEQRGRNFMSKFLEKIEQRKAVELQLSRELEEQTDDPI